MLFKFIMFMAVIAAVLYREEIYHFIMNDGVVDTQETLMLSALVFALVVTLAGIIKFFKPKSK